ncbi:MAG TPA: hypothetical protein VLA76_11485 [Candidatus Angelobacter sp.]|nr:hypothetical protein [Candidatus Angelobacter sp.]
MNRMNFAPRMPTIIVALALTLVGLLGTFGDLLPTIAGFDSATIGVWAFVAGCVVMLLGIVFEGI